jgi:hypothetical protein
MMRKIEIWWCITLFNCSSHKCPNGKLEIEDIRWKSTDSYGNLNICDWFQILWISMNFTQKSPLKSCTSIVSDVKRDFASGWWYLSLDQQCSFMYIHFESMKSQLIFPDALILILILLCQISLNPQSWILLISIESCEYVRTVQKAPICHSNSKIWELYSWWNPANWNSRSNWTKSSNDPISASREFARWTIPLGLII